MLDWQGGGVKRGERVRAGGGGGKKKRRGGGAVGKVGVRGCA